MRRLKMCTTGGRAAFRLALTGLVAVGVTWLGTADTLGQSRPTTRVANRVTGTHNGKQHALLPALKVARSTQAALQKVDDYEAAFHKREWIDGKQVAQSMTIKLRHKPFSVYLHFSNPDKGREVIYNDGRNDGKLQVHLTGFKSIVGTVSISPNDDDVMEENRYPITMIGMSNMVAKVIEQWEADMKYGDIDVKYYPNAKLDDLECKVIQTSHPKQRPGVQFQMTRLYIDSKTNLPIRVEQFGFPQQPGQRPPLVEEYTYSDVRANIGLTDIDFDVRNPNYDF